MQRRERILAGTDTSPIPEQDRLYIYNQMVRVKKQQAVQVLRENRRRPPTLSGSAKKVLEHITAAPGIRYTEIVSKFDGHPNTVTKSLQKLEATGRAYRHKSSLSDRWPRWYPRRET